MKKSLGEKLLLLYRKKKRDKNFSQKLSESDKNMIRKMINKLSTREITDIINQISGMPKKEIYNYCLKLKNEK